MRGYDYYYTRAVDCKFIYNDKPFSSESYLTI